jgi:alkylation response protein AidB-like acyl-CoA dehydrogenase
MTTTTEPTTAGPVARTSAHWTGAPAAARWLLEARAIAPALAAGAERADATGEFRSDAMELLQERRFTSMLVPEELGGGGATHAEACAVLAEVARACPSTSLTLSMHSHLVAAQVWRHHRGLPAPLLPKVAAGELVLVSTGASDWIESSGRARPVDGGFVVSGRKSPASGAPAGDVLVTSVRWDDAPDGPQVIHASVPFSAEGVSVERTWDATGMRATGSDTVVLDEVFVPEASVALVRPQGAWHPVWSVVLGAALPLIMSTYVGVAEDAADRALELARRRSDRPGVASTVGRMLNRLTEAQDAVRSMVELAEDLHFDNVLAHSVAVLSRKNTAAEAAIDTVRLAMEAGGGAAYASGSGLGRLLRDVHAVTYHPLPETQQERFSGRVALGLDPLG